MIRQALVLAAFCMATGCSSGSSEPELTGDALTAPTASEETFAGAWRSTTPSLEFVRLTVHPLSSRQGVLGARLTFSGVAWEGEGRIDGDSLVANMTPGAATPTSVIVARARDARTLLVRMRSTTGAPMDLSLTFVRD